MITATLVQRCEDCFEKETNPKPNRCRRTGRVA